jgi:hypothetical protein
VDKFLDAFVLPKLNQAYRNHLTRSTRSNEIKAVVKSSNKEKPRTQWIHCQILPELWGKTDTDIPQFFLEIEKEVTLPTHFLKPVSYSFQNWTRTQPKKRIMGQSL